MPSDNRNKQKQLVLNQKQRRQKERNPNITQAAAENPRSFSSRLIAFRNKRSESKLDWLVTYLEHHFTPRPPSPIPRHLKKGSA